MKDPNEVGKQYMRYVCFTQDKSQWWVLVKNYVLCILTLGKTGSTNHARTYLRVGWCMM